MPKIQPKSSCIFRVFRNSFLVILTDSILGVSEAQHPLAPKENPVNHPPPGGGGRTNTLSSTKILRIGHYTMRPVWQSTLPLPEKDAWVGSPSQRLRRSPRKTYGRGAAGRGQGIGAVLKTFFLS